MTLFKKQYLHYVRFNAACKACTQTHYSRRCGKTWLVTSIKTPIFIDNRLPIIQPWYILSNSYNCLLLVGQEWWQSPSSSSMADKRSCDMARRTAPRRGARVSPSHCLRPSVFALCNASCAPFPPTPAPRCAHRLVRNRSRARKEPQSGPPHARDSREYRPC